jgi:tetratricopeptide (TPR) repeat protein
VIDINKIFSRFLVALFVLLAFNSSAQSIDISKLNHRQLKKFGQNAIQLGDIYTATKYYERYIELKPEKFDALFQLAELYRFSRDYKRAESMYIRSYNGDPNGNAVALFYYAQMLKANGECEKAKEYFLKFSVSKGSKGIKNEKEYKKLGKLEILGCEALPELIKNPSKIVVEHLDTSINKAHIELSPYLLDDKTLIYSSLKVDSIELYKVDEQDKMPVRKFYVAKRVNGKWKGSKELEGPFNKEGVNTGNGTYSPVVRRIN